MERAILLLFFCCGASGVRLRAPRQSPVVSDVFCPQEEEENDQKAEAINADNGY